MPLPFFRCCPRFIALSFFLFPLFAPPRHFVAILLFLLFLLVHCIDLFPSLLYSPFSGKRRRRRRLLLSQLLLLQWSVEKKGEEEGETFYLLLIESLSCNFLPGQLLLIFPSSLPMRDGKEINKKRRKWISGARIENENNNVEKKMEAAFSFLRKKVNSHSFFPSSLRLILPYLSLFSKLTASVPCRPPEPNFVPSLPRLFLFLFLALPRRK